MDKIKLDQRSSPLEIRSYLMSEEKDMYELSDALIKRIERIDFCRELISLDYSTPDIIEKLMDRFGGTRKQAVDVVQLTDVVYTTRLIKIESLFADIRKTKELAMLKENPQAAAVCDRNKLAAIEKFYGGKDQKEYERLQPVPVEVGNFKELTAAKDIPEEEIRAYVERMRQKGREYMVQFATDIEPVSDAG